MGQKHPISRRGLLNASLALGIGTLGFGIAGSRAADGPPLTPRQTPGPFYPSRLPADADRDLTRVAGRAKRAAGRIVQVAGRVTDDSGRALAGARVEIWQCDAFGYYHHPRDRGGRADPNFQGYGRMLLGEDGRYRFTTIRPVSYPGRAPHIHFAVSGPGVERLTTQMYLAEHPQNARDFLYNAIRDPAARRSVTVAFVQQADDRPPLGHFDLVLGRSLPAN